ncbi:helix-turn-helix domain-containing protein [Actinomadura madurae]|uniref:IclR family transcriptional regulator n=1 Tax=Actinomadura madurae TaxID=1993 RepID=UPI0020261B80|nr:helix-turn-helix domain-containing protein [Actinomadura madurae]URN03188.1 helix-turn-helix domain-containing protein [Actinomadura madurae]
MSGTQRSRRPSGRPPVGEPILDRAFRLLRAFADNGESLSLQTLAACSDLPKSTALRIANQLVRVGALERRENGEFVVGLQLLEIASLAPRGHGLRAVALPVMEDLHHVTRQHILLAVREGDEGVLVERLSAADATAVKYRVGGRIPLGETGIGVALLAYAPRGGASGVPGAFGGARPAPETPRDDENGGCVRGHGPEPVAGRPGHHLDRGGADPRSAGRGARCDLSRIARSPRHPGRQPGRDPDREPRDRPRDAGPRSGQADEAAC